jgi:uncharacterized protein (DUF2141 family)
MIVIHPFRKLLLLLCCCLLSLSSAFAQDQEDNDKPARSVVRGRVLFADSEQPLRRATVRLRKEFNRDFLKRTVSGKRGEFSFQGLPAGTYYIDVDAPGVVSLSNGVSFTDLGYSIEDSSLTTVTVDGANDVKTEVRAIRGAVISGRIAYADGEPATHAQIVLYRQKGQTSVLFFFDHPVFTDDRGVYRIEGLPAGQYFVGAIENHSGGNTMPRDAAGLVTAYHPAAPALSAATVVSVQTHSEARDVNIKFVEEPRRLSGTVKWKQNNTPIKQAIVFLRRVGDPQVDLDYLRFVKTMTPPGKGDNDTLIFREFYFLSLLSTNSPYVESDNEGRWTFPEVPQGTYVVSVEAPLPVDKPANRKSSNDSVDDLDLLSNPDFSQGMLRGSAEIKIGDKDVDNLVIELTGSASIIGSVVIDGNPAPKNSVTIRVVTTGGLQSLLNIPAAVNDDGSFVLRSVPAGAVRLDIHERGVASNYYVRSITGKGLDLRNEPLMVAEGEQVTGVQVVLGTDLATVDGRVIAASGGGSVGGAGVVLLPADQRKWNTRSLWGLARADADGKFSLRLPPGEYIAAAWSLANEPTEPIDTYVRTHLSTAQRITLTPNETRTIQVQASREPK